MHEAMHEAAGGSEVVAEADAAWAMCAAGLRGKLECMGGRKASQALLYEVGRCNTRLNEEHC